MQEMSMREIVIAELREALANATKAEAKAIRKEIRNLEKLQRKHKS